MYAVPKAAFCSVIFHPGFPLFWLCRSVVPHDNVFTVLNVEVAGEIYSAIRGWVEDALNWYYMLAVMIMLLACLFLMFSRYGNIRLGDDDSRPEFRNFSWFAMLFSAGVGIGILFFGISEPMFYFDNTEPWGYPNNPFATEAALTEERAKAAMRVTYFHWGFHGWAIYVTVGLALAYFGFRRKLPLSLRSALHPLIGDKIYGNIGHAVDLLAVFGTVFGVATSLGLGVSQMASGLNHLFGIDAGLTTQLILIAIISIAFGNFIGGIGRQHVMTHCNLSAIFRRMQRRAILAANDSQYLSLGKWRFFAQRRARHLASRIFDLCTHRRLARLATAAIPMEMPQFRQLASTATCCFRRFCIGLSDCPINIPLSIRVITPAPLAAKIAQSRD